MNDLDRAFGAHIGIIRRAKKYSLREVAQAAGMDFTYLCKIERGTMPPPSVAVVRKIAEALGLERFELELMAGHLPDRLRALTFDNKYAREFLSKQAGNLTSDGWAELASVLDGWAEDAALTNDEQP